MFADEAFVAGTSSVSDWVWGGPAGFLGAGFDFGVVVVVEGLAPGALAPAGGLGGGATGATVGAGVGVVEGVGVGVGVGVVVEVEVDVVGPVVVVLGTVVVVVGATVDVLVEVVAGAGTVVDVVVDEGSTMSAQAGVVVNHTVVGTTATATTAGHLGRRCNCLPPRRCAGPVARAWERLFVRRCFMGPAAPCP